MRPSTWPSASITCQRPAFACSAVAINVDIPETPLRRKPPERTVVKFTALMGHPVRQVQATVNPNHTSVSGDCQAFGPATDYPSGRSRGEFAPGLTTRARHTAGRVGMADSERKRDRPTES